MTRAEWNRLSVGAAVKCNVESEVILRVVAVEPTGKATGANLLTLKGPTGVLSYRTAIHERYRAVIVKPKRGAEQSQMALNELDRTEGHG